MYYPFKLVKFASKCPKWIHAMKEIRLDLLSHITEVSLDWLMCICKIKIVDSSNENERLEYKEMYGIVQFIKQYINNNKDNN